MEPGHPRKPQQPGTTNTCYTRQTGAKAPGRQWGIALTASEDIRSSLSCWAAPEKHARYQQHTVHKAVLLNTSVGAL